VLNALDIKKDSVRIPTYQQFLNPQETAEARTDSTTSLQAVDYDASTASTLAASYKPYAVSCAIKTDKIGPQNRTERLEVLGFVVGDDPGDARQLPDCQDRPVALTAAEITANAAVPAGGDLPHPVSTTTIPHTGMNYLGGLYDSSNSLLMKMRPSGLTDVNLQSTYEPGHIPGDPNDSTDHLNHSHKDWPSTTTDQAILLNDNPMSDALYYHKTQLRFLLTGIDDITKSYGSGIMDNASNHRGTVRLLVLRPRTPAVRTRVDGTDGHFKINYGYMPNWDTELFYDRAKQLGGKLDPDCFPHTERLTGFTAGNNSGGTNQEKYIRQPLPGSGDSSAIVTYGLKYAESANRFVDDDVSSVHYGHMAPSYVTKDASNYDSTTTSCMKEHALTPTDLLMSKVNKQKYAVLHDEVFTLDSLHHGAAAQHIANITIPYNKKVRFPGRKEQGSTGFLSYHTIDEPLNMSSRPIILFLSYNQKISASVEGWTAISEC